MLFRFVAMLYGVTAFGFGLMVALAGGMRDLARTIVDGSLDVHLGRPRHPLPSLLMSRSVPAGFGDVASAFAVEALALIADREQLRPEDVQEAIERANATILDASREPGRSGMGTTLSGVALVDFGGSPHWLVFNIGDSRVYRIAGGTASRLTVDHSEVAELVALGKISEEDAHRHPLRHVITRALGSDPAPVADVWIFPLAPAGDLFVACSDGLTNELDDTRIAAKIGRAHV